MKNKEESTSPTTDADSTFLSLVVDACEGMFVAVADVKGVCLSAIFDDVLLMKFENEQVDIMCDMDMKHTKRVAIENGKESCA